MNKTAVIYCSAYGATKKYAEWIANELGADIFESKKFKVTDFSRYSTIIYGGGVYVGSIKGFKLITDNLGSLISNNQNLIVFSCGSADSNDKDSMKMIEENFKKALPASNTYNTSAIKHFYLRGCLDYTKMSFMHKTMMKMMISMLKKKPESEKTDADKAMINAFGGKLDFTDKSAINPIIDSVAHLPSNQSSHEIAIINVI